MSFIELYIFSLLPNISRKNLNKLKKILVFKTYKKGNSLAADGKFYILKSGVVKSNITILENKKPNTKLYISDSKSTTISNVINIPETKNNFTCLTNTVVYECSYSLFIDLINKEFEVSKIYNKILENQSIVNEKRIDDLMQLNTKERYLKLLEEIPYLEKLIPKYEIATYLNISPVQLTRIRKS